MATIMTVGNSEGSRRCDATCHEAKGPKCDCICGGRYHGKGTATAHRSLQEDLEKGIWGEALQKIARGDDRVNAWGIPSDTATDGELSVRIR